MEIYRRLAPSVPFFADNVGKVILAKWKSLISHVHNKHSKFKDSLVKACQHGHLEESQDWFAAGI